MSRMCCLGIPKWPMPFWLKSKALAWANPERASSIYSRYPQVYARRRPGRRTIAVVLPGSFTETGGLESWWHITARAIDCIPEEILGIARELPEEVVGVKNPHLARVRLDLWPRARQIAAQLSKYAPK